MRTLNEGSGNNIYDFFGNNIACSCGKKTCTCSKKEEPCEKKEEKISCGCPIKLSAECIRWTAESTTYLPILTNENLESILIKIEKALEQGSPTDITIQNVGNGKQVYKGLVPNDTYQFRTITSNNGVVSTQTNDTINFSLNLDYIQDNIIFPNTPNLQQVLEAGNTAISGNNTLLLTADYIAFANTSYLPQANSSLSAELFIFNSEHFLVQDTSIPKLGLVYHSDYSDTFIENSLITKKYVDDSISNLPPLEWGSIEGDINNQLDLFNTFYTQTQLDSLLLGKENTFSKNTAFNKDFGITVGTVAQGNDNRINNGQTAFGWGNHASAGYALSSAVTASLALKLDKPTTTGNTTTHPFVVLENGSGASARYPAGDLGKNLANSDLNQTGTRNYDTAAFPLFIKNLPDRKTNTAFTEFWGADSNGQWARIGYPAFKAQAESWTQTQRDEFATILNGGFTTGTMSINLISPPVFEKENNDIYILLRGAGLNLHPINRKIEILRASDNVVLAEIPNGQIQTYSSGTDLVFYYNFYTLGEGVYKIKITNGVTQYISGRNFEIATDVENIDLSGNSFDILTSYTNTLSYATNDSVLFEGEIQGTNTPTPIFSAISQELFAMGDDWYLEIAMNSTHTGGNTNGGANETRIGVGYSNTVNALLYQELNFFRYNKSNSSPPIQKGLKNQTLLAVAVPFTTSVIFIKQGNLLTVLEGSQVYSETISNNSGYSLMLKVPNRNIKEIVSIQIVKAFKFN